MSAGKDEFRIDAPTVGEGHGSVAVLVVPHGAAAHTRPFPFLPNLSHTQTCGAVEIIVDVVAYAHILPSLMLHHEMER